MSEDDLDALLDIDGPSLALSSQSIVASNEGTNRVSQNQNRSIMAFDINRELLPSQVISDLDITEVCGNFPSLEPSQQFNFMLPPSQMTTSSVAWNDSLPEFDSQEFQSIAVSANEPPPRVEEVEQQKDLNETIDFPVEDVKTEMLDLSSVQGTPVDKRCLDRTFEEEFAQFYDDELELPLLDDDFEQILELERAHTSRETLPLKELPVKHWSKTQLPASKQAPALQNISYTCPVPARAPLSSISTIPKCSDGENHPINLVSLEYSKSSQSSAGILPSNEPAIVVADDNPLDFSRAGMATDQGRVQPDRNSVLNFPSIHQDGNLSDISVNPGPEAAEHQSVQPKLQINLANSSTADPSMIPLAVKQLYDIIKAQYSDFAFIYALSAQLCQDRVPMDCFVNLKMGLLLSLVSIGPNLDRPPIPIIAIGNDTYMANYLMMNVGQLAARFIGPTDDVKPPSSAGDRNHNWVEADPILLAKGGVFYVGDWCRLKLARTDKLLKDIECSRIAIEKSTYVYPLETAIWAHWRSFKFNAKDQQTFNKFVKIFGIPIYVDDDNHEVLVNYMLEQSSVRIFESTVDHLSISVEDMRNFLAIISRRTVDLTAEASVLLQKYFVASRMERPDCLTKQAFVVLKQFSESFAKLSFRHEVIILDVVAAIYMCENFIQKMFGAGMNPPPAFISYNFVGLIDEHMAKFQDWLLAYIDTYYQKK